MAFQGWLGLLPAGSEVLCDRLAVCREDDMLTFFNPAGPIVRASVKDPQQLRLAGVLLRDPDIGGGVAIGVLARALGVHRSSLHNWEAAYKAGGIQGLRGEKKGPKRAHKLEGERLAVAQRALDEGLPRTAAARRAEVTEGTVRLALRRGRLRMPQPPAAAHAVAPSQPQERNERDRTSSGGVAVQRHEERLLAARGKLVAAPPLFAAAASVAKAGVLIALPAVIAQGLYEAGSQVYGALRNGFFGLDSVLSVMVLMMLLRIRNIEQLSTHAPGEFGLVLGLDRSPECKTLRRKLAELGARGQALEFQRAFTALWAAEQPDLLGFLYVDGHVRPYNGRKHRLPKTHVPRRRLCMPATTDYWVNDAFADPLFFVTAPANEGLLAILNEQVLPEVRAAAGKARVTLVMDRECWSPDNFKAWSGQGFDIMTYRKGRYDPWPEARFEEHQAGQTGRKPVLYRLAEAPLELSNGFQVREIRCLTADGHQTSVVTTRRDMSIPDVAERMFSRWKHENYFRYMRHEFALDHLPSYATEPADAERPVPNPARKEKKKEVDALRRESNRIEREYGERALAEPADTAKAPGRAGEIRARLAEVAAQLEHARNEYRALPAHVPVGKLQDAHTIVQLERERKIITDQIRMVAYRAETELACLVAPLLGRHHDDEARSFLRQVFQLPAELIPDYDAGTLCVRLHAMANWRSNRALRGLCTLINSYDACYPGTELRLVFEPPPSNE